MINRFTSRALVIALVCTVGATSARANTPPNTDPTGKAPETLPASSGSARKEIQPNEKLRTGLAKLVSDTKAGKGKMSAPAQFPPTRSNSLSKGQKIAIGVGIVVAVVVVIVVVHQKRGLFDTGPFF